MEWMRGKMQVANRNNRKKNPTELLGTAVGTEVLLE
jgi:hypothetical protein